MFELLSASFHADAQINRVKTSEEGLNQVRFYLQTRMKKQTVPAELKRCSFVLLLSPRG